MNFSEYVKLYEAMPGMPTGAGPGGSFGSPPAGMGMPAGAPMGGPMNSMGPPMGAPAGMPPNPLDPTGMGGPNAAPTVPPANVKVKDVWHVLEKVLSKKDKK